MDEDKIRAEALELIFEWICIVFILIISTFGWWKVLELLLD